MNMKAIQWILVCVLGSISGLSFAASAAVPMVYEMPKIDLRDQASLQRGATIFMNYCSGCHGLEHLRYTQMAKGIGMVDGEGKTLDAIVTANLIFSGDRIGDLAAASMTKDQGKAWFGTKVPDLTLETKVRGPEWVYNYLLAFYPDPARPWGVNNAVFRDVAMPNVLEGLQGVQKPLYKTIGTDADNRPIEEIIGFELIQKGEMTPEEFQQVAYDVTNFLVFASDPKKLERERLGVIVILFLIVFTALAYLLKREYWKDIHDSNLPKS
jgi:ubiquinol-cytochrome c reductase cytochrome c1 subunit